jgi:hypothetical protein
VFNTADSQSRAVFHQPFQPVAGGVAGYDPALISELLGDVGGLPARCGAGVEDGFAGPGTEFVNREKRAGVLKIEPAFLEAGQAGNRRMFTDFEHQTLRNPVLLDAIGPDSLRFPIRGKSVGGGQEKIGAGEGMWRRIVPSEKLLQRLGIEGAAPAVDEPLRMRPTGGWIGVAQGEEFLRESGVFAEMRPEDGVNEAGAAGKAQFTGQFDGFVDRGESRNAVEEVELIEPQPQQMLENRGLRSAVGLPGDQPIERHPPSGNAEQKFLNQASVVGRECPHGRVGFEPMFEKIGGPKGAGKETGGNLSWCGNHRAGILPATHVRARIMASL